MALPAPTRDALADWVLRTRYAAPGEGDPDAVRRRVARALAEAEAPQHRAAWSGRFLAAMRNGFIPAGRILASAGKADSAPHATWVNCFVQPLGNPRAPGPASGPDLPQALEETLRTLRAGGGVGLDFSPRDDPVEDLHTFDRACAEATDRGIRPGAMMGMLSIEHPRIAAFIDAKRGGGLTHFNLSVAVSDDFMRRLQAQEPRCRALWQRLCEAAWAGGEPGVAFMDTIRRDDSLAASETLRALNPCGEQPLPAYGSCCLGSIDLTRFVRHGLTPAARVDHAALARVSRVAVRMLDNVIDLTPWPLPQQATEARRTRRIGLGITGLADALLLLGLRYRRAEGRHAAAAMLSTLRDAAFGASVALARERGAFPVFDAASFLAPPGYASRLPKALQAAIARHGLRHSHLLSLAPAGSISLAMADGVSSGVEPVWGWQTARQVRDANGTESTVCSEDPVWRRWRHRHGAAADLPPAFETLDQVSPAAQWAMVAALAPAVDGAISKTLHLPAASSPRAVSRLLHQAWRVKIKGLAIYRPSGSTAEVIRPCGAGHGCGMRSTLAPGSGA